MNESETIIVNNCYWFLEKFKYNLYFKKLVFIFKIFIL